MSGKIFVTTVSRWYLDKSWLCSKVMYMTNSKNGGRVWQTEQIISRAHESYVDEMTREIKGSYEDLPFIPKLQRGSPVTPQHEKIIKDFYISNQYNPLKER